MEEPKPVKQEKIRKEEKYAELNHRHVGYDNPKIYIGDLLDNLNIFNTVSVIPTAPPQNTFKRMQVYISGGSFRLYVWDYTNSVWRYSTLT